MRVVGDTPISLIPRQARERAMINANMRWHKQTCIKCGDVHNVKLSKIKAYFKDGYTCYPCHSKGKDEMLEAKIAIAKRKLAIKNKG